MALKPRPGRGTTEILITGVSSQIAQALVTLGADLGRVQTLADLQSGIERAEKLLMGTPRVA